MNCPRCGAESPDGARFCPACGAGMKQEVKQGMIVPRFWAKGEQRGVDAAGRKWYMACWRWSDESEEAARALATDAAKRVLEARMRGVPWPGRYQYDERIPHEEVLSRDLPGCSPGAAVVTRNGYGAQVLNCAEAPFVDIDLPFEPLVFQPMPRQGFLSRLFGRGPEPEPPRPTPRANTLEEVAACQRVREWVAAAPGRRLRLYRTAAGLRALALHEPMQPDGPEAEELMGALEADALYVRLCRAQKSFRARLTPKPWRVGLLSAPMRRPDPQSPVLPRQNAWVRKYEELSRSYSACELIEELGGGPVHERLRGVLAMHDLACGVGSGRPLA